MKIVLACDESGAKGYSDRDEAFDGEVGVFAGIMVPDSHLAAVEPDFQAVFDAHKSPTGKLHITDLDPAEQAALREEIYAVIRKHNLPCFWYAIHVAGFHAYHTGQQAMFKELRADAQAAAAEPGRFKGGSPRQNPESLHVALFDGLYGHLVAFLEERNRKDVDIEVRTDRVDNPIVDSFEEVAKRLLGNMVFEKISKRFDTFTKSVVSGQIRVEAHLPPSMDIDLEIKSLEIRAVDDNDGMVLAADVLANSLNHLFKHRSGAEKYTRLNYPTAIQHHPLSHNLAAFHDWGDGDLVGDNLYRHPKATY